MRNRFSLPRLLVLGLISCTSIALTTDTASAQMFRRGGVGIGVGVNSGWYGGPGYGGYGYGGYGYGGYGGYGYNGYRGAWNAPYRAAWNTGYYNGYSPSYGYTGSSYYSYPSSSGVMAANYAADGSVYSSSACCDPCASAPMVAYSDQPAGYAAGYTPQQTGLRIVDVQQQSPAQAAGIQTGAVIEKVDGQPVHTFDELQTFLRNSNDNQSMKITIIDANGQRQVRDITPRDQKFGISVVETSVTVPSESNQADPNRPETIPQPLPDRNTRPDGTRPDVTRPDATQPNRTVPERGTTPLDRSRPDVTTPDRTNPRPVTPTPPTTPRPADPTRPNVD